MSQLETNGDALLDWLKTGLGLDDTDSAELMISLSARILAENAVSWDDLDRGIEVHKTLFEAMARVLFNGRRK